MNDQQTLGGDMIADAPEHDTTPESTAPPVKPCDICGTEVAVDGEHGYRYGGQVFCDGDCSQKPVAFVAYCECCGWTERNEGTEANRWAVRQAAQQDANHHEAVGRKLRLIHHETGWREADAAPSEVTDS